MSVVVAVWSVARVGCYGFERLIEPAMAVPRWVSSRPWWIDQLWFVTVKMLVAIVLIATTQRQEERSAPPLSTRQSVLELHFVSNLPRIYLLNDLLVRLDSSRSSVYCYRSTLALDRTMKEVEKQPSRWNKVKIDMT